jgi:putative restriction endonuclease
MENLTSEHRTSRAWLVISDDKRKHAGNFGYNDEFTRKYEYNSLVQNHLQVTEGDFVLIRDKKQLLGIAIIEIINSYQGIINLLLCPSCNKTKFNERDKKKPKFHCYKCGHDFDEGLIKAREGEIFTAHYGNTFIAAKGAVSIDILRQACLQEGQMSIKLIDLEKIKITLLKNAPIVANLLNKKNGFEYLQGEEAPEYVLTEEDSRETL